MVNIEISPEVVGVEREMSRVSIVIPSLNRGDMLMRCINAVLSQESTHEMELVVAIDGDDCGRVSTQLKEDIGDRADVQVNASQNRRGSPRAKNDGASLATGDIIVFLDDDTEPERDWLNRLIDAYVPGVVGVGGSELKPRGPGLMRRAWFALSGQSVGAISASGRVVSNFGPRKGAPFEVDCLPGCNMSFRRNAFIEVAGFDSSYGGNAYREETDLCMRISRSGRLIFVPEAVVRHHEEPSGGNSPSSARQWNYWYHRNNTYFFLKNFGDVGRTLWLRHVLSEIFLSLARAVSIRNWSPLTTMRQGMADGTALYESARRKETNG